MSARETGRSRLNAASTRLRPTEQMDFGIITL
jgi:hypothetical protein